LNEVVRLSFRDTVMYHVLGHEMHGVNIWIAFKLLFIMPVSGIYAWLLTTWMARHRISDPALSGAAGRGTVATRRGKADVDIADAATESSGADGS
jgi:intracellular septation protein